jgi:hypothetical protein
MQKTLVHSDGDVVRLFMRLLEDANIETVETMLGIEFANEAGKFPLDYDLDDEAQEAEHDDLDGTVDENVWRRREDSDFPETYPALVVHHFESVEDCRLGGMDIRLFEYVYLKDFMIGQ